MEGKHTSVNTPPVAETNLITQNIVIIALFFGRGYSSFRGKRKPNYRGSDEKENTKVQRKYNKSAGNS